MTCFSDFLIINSKEMKTNDISLIFGNFSSDESSVALKLFFFAFARAHFFFFLMSSVYALNSIRLNR